MLKSCACTEYREKIKIHSAQVKGEIKFGGKMKHWNQCAHKHIVFDKLVCTQAVLIAIQPLYIYKCMDKFCEVDCVYKHCNTY